MPAYEFFEHTADVGFRARGNSFPRALSAAAEALTEVMTGRAQIAREQVVSFEIDADDAEQLVVDVLSRLVYLFDAEGFVAGRCEINVKPRWTAAVAAYGEPFDAERHGEGLEVKAVAYHMLKVEQPQPDQWLIQVLLDV